MCAFTEDPGQDHPLDDGRGRALHVEVGAGDVLRCQQQQEQEGQVRRRVADELNEGLLNEPTQSAFRSQQVDLEGIEVGNIKQNVDKTQNP